MPSRQQVLGDAGAVGERQVLAGGMGARRLDRLAGGVQAEDVEAATRQRLGRHSGAAADVEKIEQARMCRRLERKSPPPPAGGGWGEGAAPKLAAPPPSDPLPQAEGESLATVAAALGPDLAPAPPPHPARSTIHWTRAGFIRCSGRIGPFGSHQLAASASNRATSSGETRHAWHGCPCCPAPV